MSAIDDFISTQPGASPSNAPQNVDALIARDSATSSAQAPRAPQTAQGTQPGMFASFGAGLGHGVQQTMLGAQQLAGRGLTALGSTSVGPWLTQDAESGIARGNADYAPYQQAHPIAAGAGNFGGNVAATAPLALAAPEIGGLGLIGRAGTGAALGAANGAVAPVTNINQVPSGGNDFWQQKLGQIGMNAALGGVMTPAMAGLGGAVQGVTDPMRQRLAAAGVNLTPGQALGGAWQTVENKLSSVPVLGDFIRNGQQRSVQSFNRAAYQGALDPIGATLPQHVGVGSDGVAYVRNQIGNVYDSIVPRASLTADQNLGSDIATIRANLSQNAPGALPQFDNIVNNQITGKLQGGAVPQGGTLPIGGTMTGNQWNNTRSTITGIARDRLSGNSSPDDRVLSDSLGDLTDAINSAVGRSSPPDVLPTLGRANAAYAQYKQLERAAGSVGASNNGNVFTAAQYANGVRNGSTAFQRATNSGLNGQLANDGTAVLGNRYPDSGTAGRSLLALGLGALAGHSVLPPAALAGTAAGVGLGALPYTALGGRLTQGLLMNRPAFAQPVANTITNRLAPLVPGLLGALAQ